MDLHGDALKALSGAEYVRDQFVSLLACGPNSIRNKYYAIKSRVKSESSLVTKIEDRRGKGRQQYSASDITDIVGVRILTIFSQDLLGAAHDLLDFLVFCQSPQVALCVPGSLDNAIREIIIYQGETNPEAYRSVHVGLSRIPFSPLQDGSTKLKLLPASTDRPYSSIHILTECVSQYASSTKVIPVEVQIRTVFEDAWNEVDHPIRYKGGATDKITRDLGRLKKQLDIIGQYADDIRHDHAQQKRANSSNHSLGETQVLRLKLREQLNVSTGSALYSGSVAERYDVIEAEVYRVIGPTLLAKVPDLDAQIDKLNLCLKDIDSLVIGIGASSSTDADLKYFVGMLRGYIHTHKARLVREAEPTAMSKFDAELNAAMSNFVGLENSGIAKDDALVKFRLSTCSELKGLQDVAIGLAREAVVACESDKRLRVEGYLRAAILRHAAGVLRRKWQLLDREPGYSNAPSVRERHVEALMRECVELNFKAAQIGKSSQSEIERGRTLNNLVSHFWEYKERFDIRAFDTEISDSDLTYDEMASGILQGYGDHLRAGQVDSVVKAMVLAGRHSDAIQHAKELKRLLEIEGGVTGYSLEEVKEMSYTLEHVASKCALTPEEISNADR